MFIILCTCLLNDVMTIFTNLKLFSLINANYGATKSELLCFSNDILKIEFNQ